MRHKEGILVYGILTVIILIILFPLLSGKYLFLLDFIPRVNGYRASELFYGKVAPVYGGTLPFNLIQIVIPSELFQKLLLFLILFLSAYSMHSAVSKITSSKIAQFYASLLYMLNPYTYIRTVAG